MKQAHRQERILSSTLTESLILFLFILLAIADIYQKREEIFKEQGMIPPGHKAVEEDAQLINKDQLAIDKEEYDKLKNNEENFSEFVDNKNKEIDILKGQLIDRGGVNPPPCVFTDSSQIFFEVRFLPGKKYHLKFKNPDKPLKFANWTVQKGTELILENNELRKFGNAVVATNRINKNDDFCCCNAPTKNLSSAFCTKCVYVYEHKDLAVETFRFSRVDGPTTAAMIKTIELFFYRI